ncbi:MAG: tetratricopeptide repeat protein [Burkholderiales bacterium]|nr:tetratricopeptide repeat protein [Burkholderiales bacterium]
MPMTPSRNAPCPCGSGKKYKHCCAGKTAPQAPTPADFNQLAVLFKSGRYVELERHTRMLLEQYPEAGLVWKLLCIALQMQGKDTLLALQKAAKFLPNDAEIHNNLGNVLQAHGQHAEAAASLRRALMLAPDFVEAHANLGNALKDLGQLDAAVASYRRVLKINPNIAELHSNLGAVLHELQQFDEAVASHRRALELNPQYAAAHNNLGNVLRDLGQLDRAAESFRQALAIQPDYADAHNNLGAVLRLLGQFDDAMACSRSALEIKPDYDTAHINFSHLLLEQGDFAHGWQEYEWRDARGAVERRVPVPLPKASSLLPFTSRDKRILLCHEQGIGDELFFLRFASQLRADAQWVGYWSSAKVQTLIARSECVDQIVSRFEEAPARDLILPVGDLPLLLACNSTTAIPSSLRFPPTEQAIAKVHQRLSELGLSGQRLLGVTWRGGSPPVPGKPKTLFKQIGLNALADAIKDWKGAIVVLQRKPEAGEIEQLRAQVSCPVHDLSEYNDDLESMLALLDVLDEYVGVSNANMHLMAGLGKTARVLIPFPAEWRWMASGDQSPWFPGFRIYRETVEGGWQLALDAIKRGLANLPK